MTVVGLAVNIFTGFLVSRIQVRTLVVVSAILTLPASILMATIHPNWSYWRAPFWAMLLSPVHPDGKPPSLQPVLKSLSSAD